MTDTGMPDSPPAPSDSARPDWKTKTRGGRAGNSFFVVLIRCGGMWLAPFFLFWVALYFLIAAPEARRNSFDLARRLGRPKLWFAFRHFYTFGMLLLDKIAILGANQGDKYQIEFIGEEHIRDALKAGKGAVLLTAHLGNWEAMGHLLTRLDSPFCMVMYDAIDERLRETIENMARDRSFRILYTDGSPSSAAAILSALRGGELVGMMGDRILAGDTVEVPLLGSPARFPIGAYVVCAAAHAPLIHVFAVRDGWRRYTFHGLPAGTLGYTDRKNKRADLHRWASEFASRLEEFLSKHPHQWGNFFPFWGSGQ